MTIRRIKILVLIALASVNFPVTAGQIILNPSDDGFVDFYSPTEGVANTSQTIVSDVYSTGVMRGVVEFPLSSITGSIRSAVISVSPAGTPIHDNTVEVYAYESNDGLLTVDDFDAGVFIGILNLPDSLNIGDDAFFDVTDYLRTANSPFVGFVFRTESLVGLMSLEDNYGRPAQLTVSTSPNAVPATPGGTLLLTAIALVGAVAFVQRRGRKIYGC